MMITPITDVGRSGSSLPPGRLLLSAPLGVHAYPLIGERPPDGITPTGDPYATCVDTTGLLLQERA
jgi:hypothetical protein